MCFREKKKKKIKVLSAVVVFSALRVNKFLNEVVMMITHTHIQLLFW